MEGWGLDKQYRGKGEIKRKTELLNDRETMVRAGQMGRPFTTFLFIFYKSNHVLLLSSVLFSIRSFFVTYIKSNLLLRITLDLIMYFIIALM